MLELAILGLLQDTELHGYELKKRLGETLGPFSGASFGSLYPALRRLEGAGAVKAVEAHEAPASRSRPTPMTGSLGGELAAFAARHRNPSKTGGRKKKVYGITERGRALFDELLAGESSAAADDDRTFTLRLAFARYLPPASRLRLLERRRAHLVERLAQARSSARARQAEGRIDLYTRSVLEHANDATERDITWLDALIEAEKGS
ncbi:MAG TPA: PadR family transcriptional regulator [Acidimicrobiales bacterium]|nr:PadR family transcriptional regulator [Acidimicrobiales bacterium]